MKTTKQFMLVSVCAAALNSNTPAPAQSLDALPPATEAPAPTTASFPDGQGLRFEFRAAPLAQVLTYMSRAAGFIVYFRHGVSVDGQVDAWSEQPLNKTEAVNFLKTVLSDHGYSVLQNDRTLTILRTGDMPTETPIRLGSDPAKIPNNAEVVTQIIPVRSLNPDELNRVLQPLLPATARLGVNESANALLLTDTQAGIRRTAEIIAALDSVSSTANSLRVFPLKYEDAKILAGLIKEIFPAPAATARGGNNAGTFINFPGARGLRGANAPGRASSDDGQTPVTSINAVADEHGNAVIVSAPEAMLPAIEKLVESVDVPVDDATEVELFTLTNADAVEMADMLGKIYPDDNPSSDAGGTQIRFNGQGNRGAQAVGARQGTAGETGSDRLQKLGRVLAVPDSRTSSLLVSAAKTQMPDIRLAVARLDAMEGNRLKVHSIQINYAEAQEVAQLIRDLYPSGTASTTASSTQTDPLIARQTAIWNNQLANGPGSGSANGITTGPAATSGRGTAP